MPRQARATPTPSTFLRARIDAVFRQLPPALAGNEEALHQLRVAARRLRVALPLVARKPAGRRVRRARALLRALVRAAGRGRDLDVLTALFDRHAPDGEPAVRRLRRRLRDARRRARARLAGDLLDVDVARLRCRLAVIVRRGTCDASSVEARVAAQAAADSSALTARLAALGPRFDAPALHGARIACRRLRYAAEVRAALDGGAGEAVRRSKELQEQLGAIHDAHLLALWLARQAAADARGGRADLTAAARRIEERVRHAAHAQHAAWLRGDPRRVLEAVHVSLAPRRPAA